MTAGLIEVLRDAYYPRAIADVSTKPYPYATSFALTEVDVRFADGDVTTLILKDFDRARMLDDARVSRPEFLDDPAREIATYRTVLAPAGIGPRCVAAIEEPSIGRYWLICEKWDGAGLWQMGDIGVWEAVASWTARFHHAFAPRVASLAGAHPGLLHHDAAWFTTWATRARAALAESSDPAAHELVDRLDGYDRVVDALVSMPVTLVHGELYPSNVLVAQSSGAVDVCPIDWEMAAIGPALIDVAALVSGWDTATTARLLDAYGDLPGSSADLDRCRLHLALQWLGWSPEWRPPASQARDWLSEALRLAQVVLT